MLRAGVVIPRVFAEMLNIVYEVTVYFLNCRNDLGDDHCLHWFQQSGQLSAGAKAGQREVQRSVRGHKCDQQ